MSRAASPRTPRSPRRTSPSRRRPAPRRVLVTGADSLIGTHVLQRLLAASYEVVGVTHRRTDDHIPPGVIRVVAERASPAWGDWAAGCCAAVHVGPGLGERPSDDGGCRGVGAGDTAALLAACQRQGISRVVLVSCLGAAAHAASARQRAAWAAEQVLRDGPTATTVLRPAWLAAPGPSLLARLVDAVQAGRPIFAYGGGRYPLQTVGAGDVARAVEHCLDDSDTAGHTFDLAGGDGMPFIEMVRRTAAGVRQRSRIIVIPRRFSLPLVSFLQHRSNALLTRDELLALWAGTTVDSAPGQKAFGPLSSGLDPAEESPCT